MSRNGLTLWLRGTAIILCTLVSASLTLPFSGPTQVSAQPAPTPTPTCFASPALVAVNAGAAEVDGATIPVVVGVKNTSCPGGQVSITGGSADFGVSSPPAGYPKYQPSCYPSLHLNTGQTCWYWVTFSPTTEGAREAGVTASLEGAAYVVDFYGAGFSLSPENHDKSGELTGSNGFCTGSGDPYPCCTGASTGTCVDAFPFALPSSQATVTPFSPGFASITFDPGNTNITFSATLAYQTSGHVPKSAPSIAIAAFTATATPYMVGFGTVPSGVATPEGDCEIYHVAGGQLTLSSSYEAPSSAPSPIINNPATNNITGYVTGLPAPPGINNLAITNQLDNLYETSLSYPTASPTSSPAFTVSGATTTGLMAQVAMQESSYEQFFKPLALPSPRPAPYGINDFWPVESPPNPKAQPTLVAGAYIGLMQVPVSMQDAWDWVQNTQDGVSVFQTGGSSKLQTSFGLAQQLYNNYTVNSQPSLPNLTSCQLEEMALDLYGAPKKLIYQQYYIPTCVNGKSSSKRCGNYMCYSCTGSWKWEINTQGDPSTPNSGNLCGVCYAAAVRSAILPSGVPTPSATSCTGTAPLPDPPTSYNKTVTLQAQCKKKCHITIQ